MAGQIANTLALLSGATPPYDPASLDPLPGPTGGSSGTTSGGSSGMTSENGQYTVGQVSGLSEAEAWIIQHESGGNPTAQNPTSTAFGIWQGLDTTRATYAARFGYDPGTTDVNQQLTMFRAYIADRYGTPEAAMQFWQKNGWY